MLEAFKIFLLLWKVIQNPLKQTNSSSLELNY